jgi:hypothetical protein
MKNPAEIPPNSNKNWSSSQQFSPKKRFFALFQQNNVEKNSLKTGIIVCFDDFKDLGLTYALLIGTGTQTPPARSALRPPEW